MEEGGESVRGQGCRWGGGGAARGPGEKLGGVGGGTAAERGRGANGPNGRRGGDTSSGMGCGEGVDICMQFMG